MRSALIRRAEARTNAGAYWAYLAACVLAIMLAVGPFIGGN